jgi:hypothetical protein
VAATSIERNPQMKIYGCKITAEHQKQAKITLDKIEAIAMTKPHLAFVRKISETLAERIEKVRENAKGLTIEKALQFIEDPELRPLCICGDEYITTFNRGVPHKCNQKRCCKRDEIVMEERREENIKKYGVTHPMKLASNIAKMNKTNEEKYGSEHPRTKNILKAHKMSMKKHGAIGWAVKEMRDKTKATMMERYGVEHSLQSSKLREKKRKTTQELYHVDHTWQSPSVKRKRRNSLIEHYGVDTPMASKEVQEKFRATSMERYGVESPMQNASVFYRSHVSRYKHKEYKLGKRMVQVQGYEPRVLNYLVQDKGIKPNRIVVGSERGIPRFLYNIDGKERYYFPDAMIDGNRIIEVKSCWTLLSSENKLLINKAKANCVVAEGFQFHMIVVDMKGIVRILNKNWVDKSREELSTQLGFKYRVAISS